MEKLERTIKALSLGRIEDGQIGFMTKEEEGKWYNAIGDTEILQELAKNVIAKGNKIKFDLNNGVVGSITLVEKAPESDDKFDMTSFEELLNSAHKQFGKNLVAVKSDPMRNGNGDPMIDFEKKTAVFKVSIHILMGDKVRVFEAHGDSTPENITGQMIKPHFIRMAETRALSRALRWATNNAACAIEETEQGELSEEKVNRSKK